MINASNTAGRRAPVYSLVIPIFNEEAVLPLLVRRITALLDKFDAGAEAIFVDDGSQDTSVIFLRGMAATDQRFRLIELSRNFGHQIAITAGMDAAAGEAVIVMDADLQDPPEVVLDLVAKWKEGYEIVYARRTKREGETLFKRASASLFYRALEQMTSVTIPRDVGDFRLVGRKALETFRQMPERDRFVRGMFGWMGFKQTAVSFDRPERAAGETKYPFWKMVRLAVHGVISFSDKPLRLALWSGLAISGFAAMLGVYALFSWLFASGVVHGWTSTVMIISFLSGINLFMTGIIGLYVGGIHAEVKRRPLYVVDRLTGFEEAIAAARDAEAPKHRVPATRERRLG
ncbi:MULTISPECIES: glycosyltransferase family 2 protein [unclassified Mesorhizobium]|uniref:glycosyltransferase family 2 protein n=1 Tax=unclassified Mesorhizobium TaxID=325217 RepID=UPI001FEF00FA|nr:MULTISPECIES: glycosyltransferase family 2 protein [unclassified Mesorhizobium]